ncbi:uncharacterized protein PV06_11450 [Exophiala oligosperma]|uniref:Uncharacterized protein n=1 Tax=Exophiala oligosperma TaxID=215243 RepID=A0A0D2BFI0_9EURO|nr:uncharacterized protein PV06_11450 [Exophiala oligosperma]KIW36262.1 hypothetical protein PV06_11450 [Exophiala oligosperma]
MSTLFYAENSAPLQGFPSDFDGCITFCEESEGWDWPFPEKGKAIAMAIYEQFAFRCFPPLLRGIGRSLPIALSLESTLKTLHIEPVNCVWK